MQRPDLDPHAVGDYDKRCDRCGDANLDNPQSPHDVICELRAGTDYETCALCCVELADDGEGGDCLDCRTLVHPDRKDAAA